MIIRQKNGWTDHSYVGDPTWLSPFRTETDIYKNPFSFFPAITPISLFRESASEKQENGKISVFLFADWLISECPYQVAIFTPQFHFSIRSFHQHVLATPINIYGIAGTDRANEISAAVSKFDPALFDQYNIYTNSLSKRLFVFQRKVSQLFFNKKLQKPFKTYPADNGMNLSLCNHAPPSLKCASHIRRMVCPQSRISS